MQEISHILHITCTYVVDIALQIAHENEVLP